MPPHDRRMRAAGLCHGHLRECTAAQAAVSFLCTVEGLAERTDVAFAGTEGDMS
jgi:hypothetical protein